MIRPVSNRTDDATEPSGGLEFDRFPDGPSETDGRGSPAPDSPPRDPVGVILGVDFGERRIGLAIGQTVTGVATPLTVLEARNHGPDWTAIAGILAEWQPDAVILGLPLDVDGGEQAMSVRVRRFARQLEGRFGLQVHLVDERFSSREARARERAAADTPGARPSRRAAAGTRGRKGAANTPTTCDHVAAQIILEDWLRARER